MHSDGVELTVAACCGMIGFRPRWVGVGLTVRQRRPAGSEALSCLGPLVRPVAAAAQDEGAQSGLHLDYGFVPDGASQGVVSEVGQVPALAATPMLRRSSLTPSARTASTSWPPSWHRCGRGAMSTHDRARRRVGPSSWR